MSRCLTRDELDRYRCGEVSEAEAARIRAHIERCRTCSEADSRIGERYDALIDHVKRLDLSGPDLAAMRSRAPSEAEKAEPDSPPSGESAGGPGSLPPDALPGYDITRELHRGGQGVVYEAIQTSTKRKVAIKVLIEGPHASRAARKRFEREIELVAGLKHPNIVAVFDSGVTRDGRQFCVMDYVAGDRLDHYLRERRPSLRAMLELFATTCEAINYAHQRGVIHRDIKPSNILVDGDGMPKVVDFGLAKQMAGAAEPLLSMTGQILGTLPYLAPEQARGKPEAVDVRTDVYALGVILYQMLTGTYPYPVTGDLPDVVRHISETDPRPPSRAEKPIASIRDDGAADLPGFPVDNELETIVLKALAKERERRYQSALDLARDVRHYLADEPITAKRDSSWYVIKKTMGKHKAAVATCVGFAVLLLGWGITVSLLYGREAALRREVQTRAEEAKRQRDRALTAESKAEARFKQIREMAESFLFEFHDKIKNLSGATSAREFVVAKALSYLDSLAREAADDVDLQLDLARAYLKVGDVQGGAGEGNLGDTRGAAASYERALHILKTLRQTQPDNIRIEPILGACASRMATLARIAGRIDEADRWSRQALETAKRLHQRNPADLTASYNLAVSHDAVGETLIRLGRVEEAMRHLQAAHRIYTENLAKAPSDVRRRQGVMISDNTIGSLAVQTGRLEEALSYYEHGLRLAEEIRKAEPHHTAWQRDVSIGHDLVGSTLLKLDRTDAALEHLTAALRLDAELAEADSANAEARRDLAISHHRVGDVLVKKRQFEPALEHYRSALKIFRGLAAADPKAVRARGDLADAHGKMGDLHLAAGRLESAETSYRRVLEMREALSKTDPEDVRKRLRLVLAHVRLGEILSGRTDADGAMKHYQAARKIVEPLAAAHGADFEVRMHQKTVYEKLANLQGTLGGNPDLPTPARVAHWQAAARWYRRIQALLDDMARQGLLTDGNETLLEKLRTDIDQCEASIAALLAEPAEGK